MQQEKYFEYRGVSRPISFELVARCTPVISRRLPRSVASNSIASGMRAAAPVSATMPSAFVSTDTSSLAMCQTNQTNPPARNISPVAPAAMVRKPIQRARPANMSVDHFKGVVDGLTRGEGGDGSDQGDLHQHKNVAHNTDGESAKKHRCLITGGRSGKPAAEDPRKGKQDDRAAAADGASLQAEHQEMVLEVPRDKTVLCADEMQHFDHGFVGRHRAPGREGDRQHGGDEHQDENSDAC